MWKVDLQDILDGLKPDRPYVAMMHYLDRIVLKVDRPSEWCVIANRLAVHQIFEETARNPSGLPVWTGFKAVARQDFPAPNVLLLGIRPAGGLRNKFHRLLRHWQNRSGHTAICIDQQIPDGTTLFGSAAALGQSKRLYGRYNRFVDEFCEVRQFPAGGGVVGFRSKRHELSAGLRFMQMVDDRIFCVPDSVSENPPANIRKGMCDGCPWNYGNEATEMAYNLGCLPSVAEATAKAKDEGKAWACHSEPGKVCCGYAAQEKQDIGLPLYTEAGTHSFPAGGSS